MSGGGPNAALAAHLAAALGNHHDASITIFRADAVDAATHAHAGMGVEEFNRQFGKLKLIAEMGGARNIIQRSAARLIRSSRLSCRKNREATTRSSPAPRD